MSGTEACRQRPDVLFERVCDECEDFCIFVEEHHDTQIA